MAPIIKVENLRKYYLAYKIGLLDRLFGKKPAWVRAVDDVSLEIEEGETLGLVGESGSGKTTLGKLLVTLERPDAGKYYFMGREVNEETIPWVRQQVAMVFQNPYSSLNPRLTVKEIISEPLGHFDEDKVREAMEMVGLNYREHGDKRPRELSGGQVQRVAIARAIVKRPRFVVLDEPTSALDASLQAQVLNMLMELKEELKMTYLYITHNIATAYYVSNRVAVMYAGKIVEYGDVDEVFKKPMHPYTQSLMSSVPKIGIKEIEPPTGEVPSLVNPPPGCRFHPRCPFAMDICRREEPPVVEARPGIYVKCWLYVKR
nr:ABC transporter ATP-binding protein [Vulcanisaeta thermophila]